MSNVLSTLVGRRVLALRISGDCHILSISTNQGDVNVLAFGDCCSEAWFADMTGVAALVGGIVQEIAEVIHDTPVEDGRTRQDVDSVYGYKIRTDRGHADLIFRNSSNGYYSGELGPFEEDLPEDMRPITKDWSA